MNGVNDWLKDHWSNLVGFSLGGPIGAVIPSLVNGVQGLKEAYSTSDGNLDLFGINSGVNDYNSAMSQDKLGYTENGIAYDRTNADSMINAINQEYAYKRDDTAVDRLFEAYKRVGINPALAFSNSAGQTLASSATTGHYSQNANEQMNSALKAGGILAIIIKLLASL